MSEDTRQESQIVSLDALYNQMHSELRSYRDHELRVATWFTSILLAILAAIVAGKYAAPGSPLGVAVERCPSLKWLLALVPVLLSFFAAWSIADAMRRCGQLQKWLTDRLEPKSETVLTNQSNGPVLRPGMLMCGFLIFLGIFSAILVIHKPSVIG
jgi:hypothetical protein